MLRPRIIPCLLVKDGGLVKTVNFGSPKYVGDPVNAVKIFNEKEVDEIIVLDIDATVKNREPNFELIRHLANECRMPFCYGGGVRTVDQAVRIIKSGVEKVAIGAAAVDCPTLISDLATHVGSQSVVAVLDVRRDSKTGRCSVWTHNGGRDAKVDPVELSQRLEALGVGEIVLNSIDQDGTMKGYDLDLVRRVRDAIGVPMTVLGGAGRLGDVEQLFGTFGTIGAGAGSLFVFKGVYRAVLINYPSRRDRLALYQAASSMAR